MKLDKIVKTIEDLAGHASKIEIVKKFVKGLDGLKSTWKDAKSVKRKIGQGARSADGATLTRKECIMLLRFLKKVDEVL